MNKIIVIRQSWSDNEFSVESWSSDVVGRDVEMALHSLSLRNDSDVKDSVAIHLAGDEPGYHNGSLDDYKKLREVEEAPPPDPYENHKPFRAIARMAKGVELDD